jgi:hypothetical protein
MGAFLRENQQETVLEISGLSAEQPERQKGQKNDQQQQANGNPQQLDNKNLNLAQNTAFPCCRERPLYCCILKNA